MRMQERYFNALVRGFCAAGALNEAERVIKRMHNDGLNMELVSRRAIPPSRHPAIAPSRHRAGSGAGAT